MSPSMMPTLLPHCESASARLTATRGLADAAFARADGDDVLDAGHRGASGRRIDRFAHARAHLHVDRGHAGDLHHGGPRLVAHLILDRTGRRRQLDGERDAAALDLQILDEAES